MAHVHAQCHLGLATIAAEVALADQESVASFVAGNLSSLLGIGGALTLSRVLRSILFEVQTADLEIYFTVGAVLFFATMAACWLPARRAARVDPMITLRSE